MQDIEGCRIVVDSPTEQDLLTFRLRSRFNDSSTHDRRKAPSNGYRAVHLIVREDGARYEIQIRTLLQHNWAEVSERLAARFGQELKYGGVSASQQGASALRALANLADMLELVEEYEALIWKLNVGAYDGPAHEEARWVEEYLDENLSNFSPDAPEGSFSEYPSDVSAWATKANRKFLLIKDNYRNQLLKALESNELEGYDWQ